MAGFQDVLDGVARVIGGTVDPNNPRRFSGADAGDGTGVSGVNYAYSAPPETIQNAPAAIVLPRNFDVPREPLTQGQEDNVDDVRVLILVNRQSPPDIWPTLTGFRDSIPAAFRAHMTLFSTANVSYGFVKQGRLGVIEWGGDPWFGLELTVRVLRVLPVTYAL